MMGWGVVEEGGRAHLPNCLFPTFREAADLNMIA
jgi:hypothetical protein